MVKFIISIFVKRFVSAKHYITSWENIMKIINKNIKGFTLIELLVVISIIGILSSFAVVSLNDARIKARDALRKGDMAQLRTALYLYFDDNSYRYPICDTGWNQDWVPADGEPVMGSTVSDGHTCYPMSWLPPWRPVPADHAEPSSPKNPDNLPAASGGDDTFIYRYISDSTGSQYALIYFSILDHHPPGNARLLANDELRMSNVECRMFIISLYIITHCHKFCYLLSAICYLSPPN